MLPLDPEYSIVLLGAGASVPAGVPAAIKMTDEMLTRFGDDPLQQLYLRATRTIIGALQTGSGIRPSENSSNIDIEQVLSAAKLLSTRFDTELTSFVSSWHPSLEVLERTFIAEPFEDIYKSSGAKAHEEIARRLSQPLDGMLFRNLVSILTLKLMHFTWLNYSARSAYFNPLLEKAKTTCLVIATLNYDNTIEIAAKALDIEYQTLGDWQMTAILPPTPPQGIDLLKLHGSTNWRWVDLPDASASITAPRPICEVSAEDMPERLNSLTTWYPNTPHFGDSVGVVFGGGNKLTAEGPFIDLFHKFKCLLCKKEHLLIIGYSFRDDHINHIIEYWFTSNPSTRITIVEAPDTAINNNRFCNSHKDQIDKRIFYDASGVVEALRKY